MSLPRIYLAGPDVLFDTALAVAEEKKAICAQFGMDGVFPLDAELKLDALDRQKAGLTIGAANIGLMVSCDAVIANLQPWHGPSADVGTVFELGFMFARGKPVFAYTNTDKIFQDRVQGFLESDYAHANQPGNSAFPRPGHPVYANEAFGLRENLMIDTALLPFAGDMLTNFKDAAAHAAAWFHGQK